MPHSKRQALAEIMNSPQKQNIKKKNDDGGPEVFRALKIMNWLNLPIFTCGVNSNYCVKDTLNGLSWEFKNNLQIQAICLR